jgi:hypothetical protein
MYEKTGDDTLRLVQKVFFVPEKDIQEIIKKNMKLILDM